VDLRPSAANTPAHTTTHTTPRNATRSGFGGSDGEPRHWVSPSRHISDWRAAFDYVTGHGAPGDAAAGDDYDPVQAKLHSAVDASRCVVWRWGGGVVACVRAGAGGAGGFWALVPSAF
jgi:hypothetical protein